MPSWELFFKHRWLLKNTAQKGINSYPGKNLPQERISPTSQFLFKNRPYARNQQKDSDIKLQIASRLSTGTAGGTILSVTMENCDASVTDRCVAQKGQLASGQLAFKAGKATATLTCELFGVIGGVVLPFPGGCPVPNACVSLSTGSCPISPGETFVYNMEVFIETGYPSVSALNPLETTHTDL